MRIDRFLFFIRLIKSRTLAQAIIETGHVRIDGKRVEKPSEEVRAGFRSLRSESAKPQVTFAKAS